MKNIDGEIIVIDNNSEDESRSFYKNSFPKVCFIWNDANIGFAKANNQALAIAQGDYILFLNPDMVLPEDCLEKCLHFIQSKNNNIALGTRMLDGSGHFLKESKRAFPSPATSFYKLFGLAKLFPRSRTFARYHLGNLDEKNNHEVDVLAGAFMLIPKKILEKTGGFDEQFFMYGEDIDLSYRIQKAGYSNYYFAETTIIHFKGESTRKGSATHIKMFYKAMSIFVKKHYGDKKAGYYKFLLNAAIFFRGSISLFSGITSKKTFKKEQENLSAKVVIAGSETEFSAAKYLLENGKYPKKVTGRIATDSDFTSNVIGNFYNLENVFSFSGAEEIIFCEGCLSFKKIINAMQKVPAKISIKIFPKGGHAILGSSNKNKTGEFILINKKE